MTYSGKFFSFMQLGFDRVEILNMLRKTSFEIFKSNLAPMEVHAPFWGVSGYARKILSLTISMATKMGKKNLK